MSVDISDNAVASCSDTTPEDLSGISLKSNIIKKQKMLNDAIFLDMMYKRCRHAYYTNSFTLIIVK